jgi:hypothetical protein
MKQIKMLGAAIIAVVALSAVASATASAALPEFTPGAAKTTFTGTSGAGTLQAAGGTIECESDTVKGELTGTTKKTGTATITFKGCAAFTIFGAKSLDAKNAGEIITNVNLELCYINKAKKEVGILTEVAKTVHVEVAGKLIEILGDAVGAITPVNTSTTKFKIVYKQKSGTQEPGGCEGKTENLLSRENETGSFTNAGEQTTEETVFSVAQNLLA